MPTCRLCNAGEHLQTVRAPVVFGDVSGKRAFYQCGACDLIYMSPSLSQNEEATFYAKEFEKFMEMRSGRDVDWSGPERHAQSNADNVRRRWNAMNGFCREGQKLLEIGCSSGFMLDKFSDEGLNVIGIEPSGGFSTYLREKHYEIYQSLEDMPTEYASSFDIICHFFVLEHISDTRSFIQHKLDLLRPGGTIFCEVPSATDPLTSFYSIPAFEEFYWSVAHHYYFTPKSIEFLMEDLDIKDYEIIPEQRYDISNHITWLTDGVPGGQGRFAHVFSDDLVAKYKEDLILSGHFDTFFLVIRK